MNQYQGDKILGTGNAEVSNKHWTRVLQCSRYKTFPLVSETEYSSGAVASRALENGCIDN